jgi:hypothetical protein
MVFRILLWSNANSYGSVSLSTRDRDRPEQQLTALNRETRGLQIRKKVRKQEEL